MPNRAPALHLTMRALAQVQRFLLDLYSTTDSEHLRRKIPAGLSTLIASDRVGFNEVEITRERRRVIPEPIPTYWKSLWPVYEAHAHEHPLLDPDCEPPPCQIVTYRDLPATWQRSALYHEYFLAVGARHQLAAHLYRQGNVRYNVNFNRACLDFSDSERALLALLSPHIARAWSNATQLAKLREPPATPAAADTAHQHVMVVDRENGRLLWLSDHARTVLGAYFDVGAAEDSLLPEPLRRWLVAQRSVLTSCEALLAPPMPFIVRKPAGQLHVRLVHLCSTTAVLLLEESRAPGPATPAQVVPPLTRRENEILDWVSAGKRNSEIGLILGVSSRTVEKHLEHIFEKLGVETRTAAIRESTERRKVPCG